MFITKGRILVFNDRYKCRFTSEMKQCHSSQQPEFKHPMTQSIMFRMKSQYNPSVFANRVYQVHWDK